MTVCVQVARSFTLILLLISVTLRTNATTANATSTTLSLTSNGTPVTSVSSGAVVTLMASVRSGAVPVAIGQVKFCDATANHCTDIHILGVAQVSKTGIAVLKFVPGIGSHSYKAMFLGTHNGASQYGGSVSINKPLSVTGKYRTTTAIAKSGTVGDYTLKATVSGFVNAMSITAPAATVSFLDTTFSSQLGVGTLGIGSTKLSFINSSNPAAADLAWSVATGDFNGDGHLDLAVANYGAGTVSIFLGNGKGGFTQARGSPISVTFDPKSIVVSDFNGDGKADLAMENSYYNGVVTILLGNGDGTFAEAPDSPILVGGPFETPGAIGVGDFNQDGIPDIVATNANNVTSEPGVMTVLLGNGDGTFTRTANSPVTVGSAPISIAVGDFNGDGIPDLAMANFAGNDVTILLGKGDGTFTPAANSPIAVGSFPTSIATADFNGDGTSDLAVTNSEYTSSSVGSVTILLGTGTGSFTPALGSPVMVGGDPVSIAVGDFNGDRKADLAVANNNDDTVTILSGSGTGKFTQATTKPVRAGNFPQSIAAADFNGDGVFDLAVANSGSATCTILLSQLMKTASATVSAISPVPSGTHLVDASYGGSATYLGSKSQVLSLTGSGAASP